jgi:hypothetical protein
MKAARAPALDIDLLEKQIAVALAAQRDAERSAERHEKLAISARESARGRRVEIGGLLLEARKAWPERGPTAKGWGELLKRVGLDDSTAYRYMQEARDPEGYAERQRESGESGESGGGATSTDDESAAALAEVDRDTWCTPKWIADAIGRFDLDPCSNERSHIVSGSSFRLERGENGLERAKSIGGDWRVFVNPPYSDVMPWIEAYRHTRFCFLLKLDPSTKWFAELMRHTELVLIPKGTRVQFEPPPGVEVNASNPFPHALFYRRASDAPAAIVDRCYVWRVNHLWVVGAA